MAGGAGATVMTAHGVGERFYSAFAARDWRTMGALYADDARFSDPVFPDLDARETRAMWRMLIARGTDLALQYRVLSETADAARVHWTARYTFSQTGRPVVNQIDATLSLRDGAIVSHVDDFGWHRWARQALGLPGLLLGWTPLFRRRVQAKARAALRRFMQRLEQDEAL
jgi:ketosteroid isomerase-like protein